MFRPIRRLEKVTIGWVRGDLDFWCRKFSGSNMKYFFEFSLQTSMCMKEAEGLQRKSCFGCTLPLKRPQYIIFKSQNKTHAFSGANRVKICAIGYTEHRGVYSSSRPNTFPQRTPILFPTRGPYFSVKRPKTIKKYQYYAYLDLI